MYKHLKTAIKMRLKGWKNPLGKMDWDLPGGVWIIGWPKILKKL